MFFDRPERASLTFGRSLPEIGSHECAGDLHMFELVRAGKSKHEFIGAARLECDRQHQVTLGATTSIRSVQFLSCYPCMSSEQLAGVPRAVRRRSTSHVVTGSRADRLFGTKLPGRQVGSAKCAWNRLRADELVIRVADSRVTVQRSVPGAAGFLSRFRAQTVARLSNLSEGCTKTSAPTPTGSLNASSDKAKSKHQKHAHRRAAAAVGQRPRSCRSLLANRQEDVLVAG